LKQRISVERLQELSSEQRERLREWWKPQDEDWYIYDGGIYSVIEYPKVEKGSLPLLSIGQCIELLAEKDMIHLQSVFAKISHGILSPDEIIDALFAALKSVL